MQRTELRARSVDSRAGVRYGPGMTWRAFAPEGLAWLVGVAFRLGLFWGFNPRMGYDTNAHTGYMAYMAQHAAIPPIDLVWTANHPPLYYALCAGLSKLGLWPNFEVQQLQILSVLFAVARLSVLWWGLRQVLPPGVGRVAALLLAGVLPCAVHGDGMISNETLNGLVGTAAIVAAYRAFSATGEAVAVSGPAIADLGEAAAPSASVASTSRLRKRSLVLGIALLLALLTKISGLLVAAAVAMGIAMQWVARPGSVRRLAPIALALVVPLAVALPIYGRHRATTGLWLPTSFERNAAAQRQQAKLPPYLQRRPWRYYLGASFPQLYARPYYPTVVDQFPMVVLASTYTDYYNYSFVTPPSTVPQRAINHRPLSPITEARMRWALLGGIGTSVALIIAYAVVVLQSLRRWNVARLVALAVPAAGLLGQLHYATKYPFDYMGLVKGLYLQFGWAPMFACFGAAAIWTWSSRVRRPLFILLAVALLAIAQYSFHGVFEW